MIKTIAAFDGRCAKVCGPARSGKTEALVQRCVTLLGANVAPESIFVEVSTAFAAQAFRRRLRAALGSAHAAADAVVVETALDACVRVLDTPEARTATGRIPRLLTPAEYNFFLEDMKTLGTPIRRLRKMLDRFYEQWSKLVPDDEWMGTEEEVTRDHGLRHLTERGAMLVQEAPRLCADYLKSDAGADARQQYAYVLCDDFQNLTYAEQTCLCLLAKTQLIVAGNVNQTIAVRTDWPNPQGFADFDALRHGVEVFALTESFGNKPALRLADALTTHGSMDSSVRMEQATGTEADVVSIKWNTPEDELNGVTKYLRTLLNAEEDVRESRTCVLVPNKRWARLAERILRKRGFEVSCAGATAGIGGDPRDTARAKALVAYTKLNLLANPDDLTAWRSWCGFDHALTNSDAWNFLTEYAAQNGLGLLEALERASREEAEPFLRANALTSRYQEGRDYIAQNARRKGFTLMRAIGAEELPEFEDVAAMLEGDEDAVALYRMVRQHAMDAAWPESAHTLHVCGYRSLIGADYDHIFVLGAIDGFMPRRDAFETVSTEEDRTRALDEERRLFYNAASKAGKLLVISAFTKAPLELAERTKMQVARVKSENGERMAIVRPSAFLSEAGDACPTTEGGQSILSRYGLN